MPVSQFPRRPVRGVSEVAEAMVDLIQKNIVAKTNVTSNALAGSNVVSIENTFHFRPGDEIVLIDYGYNVDGSTHYQQFEYAKIEEVNNTSAITLESNLVGNWMVADKTFIQKTIGHSPLYEQHVYYGDREVLPVDKMAVTIEPVSLGNEWIYIQGGLSEEYKMQITIYGKSIKMDEGKIILDKYADNIYRLFNENMHFDATDYATPVLYNVAANATSVVIEDTPQNRKEFVTNPTDYNYYETSYIVQDNLSSSRWMKITNVVSGGGELTLTFNRVIPDTYTLPNYPYLRRKDRYFYDSRVDGITYGEIQKGSAFLRAAQLSWFGKWVSDYYFPQPSSRVY